MANASSSSTSQSPFTSNSLLQCLLQLRNTSLFCGWRNYRPLLWGNPPWFRSSSSSNGGPFSVCDPAVITKRCTDNKTITPEAQESVKAALGSSEAERKIETKKKAIPRKPAGETWEDPTLAEWPENDYRLFNCDLGNEVNDDVLSKAFSRIPSFNMARVVRDKQTGKTCGYGFVSFANPSDLAAALKEMNSKYIENRPIKLHKSTWRERTDYEALQKQRNQTQKKAKLPKKSALHEYIGNN